ncbi:hypothetical protein BC833DRAFT_37652, partial [Globomyces pollinis-pini]
DIFKAYDGYDIQKTPSFKSVVEYIESQNLLEAQEFWMNYFEKLELSTGFNYVSPNPSSIKDPVKLDSSVSMKDLTRAAGKSHSTIANLCKTVWALCLRLYTQHNDIIFGNVVSGRDIPVKEISRIVGLLINTVPCRIQVKNGTTLSSLIEQVQEDHAGVSSHSQFSLSNVQKWSGVEATKKLFNTLFVFENMEIGSSYESEKSDSLFQYIKNPYSQENFNEFDIQFILFPTTSGLSLSFEFDPKVLDYDFTSKIAKSFDDILSRLVESILQDKQQMIVSDLLDISEKDKKLLMQIGAGPVFDYPTESVHTIFQSVVSSDPNHIALEHEGRSITYGELDEESNRVAAALIQRGIQ